jgi:hypothetical protein
VAVLVCPVGVVEEPFDAVDVLVAVAVIVAFGVVVALALWVVLAVVPPGVLAALPLVVVLLVACVVAAVEVPLAADAISGLTTTEPIFAVTVRLANLLAPLLVVPSAALMTAVPAALLAAVPPESPHADKLATSEQIKMQYNLEIRDTVAFRSDY